MYAEETAAASHRMLRVSNLETVFDGTKIDNIQIIRLSEYVYCSITILASILLLLEFQMVNLSFSHDAHITYYPFSPTPLLSQPI